MKLSHRSKSAQNNRLNIHPSLIYQNKRNNITKLDYETQTWQQRPARSTTRNTRDSIQRTLSSTRVRRHRPTINRFAHHPVSGFRINGALPSKIVRRSPHGSKGIVSSETVSVRRRFVAARDGLLLRSSSMRHCRPNNSGIIDQVG